MYVLYLMFFFFQAEDGIRDLVRSRGLGDVYKRQHQDRVGPFPKDLHLLTVGRSAEKEMAAIGGRYFPCLL